MFAKLYYYQNFTIPSGFDSLDVMVWGICAGVMLGVIAATFDKLFCQRMVQALLTRGAQTPEGALSLGELDIKGKWYLKGALREGKPLRKMLSVPESLTLPAKTEDIPFYLPEEKRFRAESRYENGRHPIMSMFLIAALLLVTALFVLFIVPELLTMLDNLVGFVKYGE